MRIKRLQIENFRAIKNFDEEIGPYTAFIGYNGSGKSSILHAVKWFFEDFPLTTTDIFCQDDRENSLEPLSKVKVTVTFDNITDRDRENFGPYARGEEMVLTRINGADEVSKLYGDQMVYQPFQKIRDANSVSIKRQLIQKLMEADPAVADLDIPEKAPAKEIEAALEAWENDPINRGHLEPIRNEDANHFFGAVGSDKLKIHSGFVFIPAAPDLTGQFDVSGKGSALQLLLGDILKGAVTDSINEWTEKNQKVLNELELTVKQAAQHSLTDRATRVNHHLKNYLPNVQIDFEVGLQDWTPKASPSAQSKLRDGERDFVIERQGHGVQRAALLALLQATADIRTELKQDTIDNANPESTKIDPPSDPLIVFIEEPEVYQHPVQARMMARSFVKAARGSNIQFVLATHSPYFLDPTQIDHTFRVESAPNGSTVYRAKFCDALSPKQKMGELDKYFLETVTECLFSRAALVVEGDTERAIFDSMPCDANGTTLRDLGVAVAVAGGSKTLLDMAQLVHSFGVPVIVVRDGDSDCGIALESAKKRVEHQIRKEFGCAPDFKVEEHFELARQRCDQKLNSWKSDVMEFIKKASEIGFGGGLDEFEWGGGLQQGDCIVVLPHDLESELEKWPSFMNSADNFGLHKNTLRDNKKAGILARIASQSRSEDMPESLRKIMEKVSNLATH
ncbi:AAA family ATPase [Corynebacterium sp. MSK044]|uniref:ATP-dependent nuclease n=1 Tax=Corynebacterium sp. MSK044 TaxID=3050195 RepID=UPI00254B1540|nr:AAA family ATPase [Corynebacterium sp. MSK044]MDK8797725.1 AAA family ATPase [Corynebacterium sp. MSK044]